MLPLPAVEGTFGQSSLGATELESLACMPEEAMGGTQETIAPISLASADGFLACLQQAPFPHARIQHSKTTNVLSLLCKLRWLLQLERTTKTIVDTTNLFSVSFKVVALSRLLTIMFYHNNCPVLSITRRSNLQEN